MSIIRLGPKSPVAEAPSALLLDCHARIRSFAALAVRLAEDEAPDDDLTRAAADVHRYFVEALPLHVADEEQSLAPRLRRLAPDVADALVAMEREHRAHAALLARLIGAWDRLRTDPGPRRATRDDARLLRDDLEAHLAAEERLVIPALARLPDEEQRAFAVEVRARRRR